MDKQYVRAVGKGSLLAYINEGQLSKGIHLYVFCKLCGLGYRKDHHVRHVQRKHRELYESKQAVGLLKEDEEPLDPAMTNWVDYAFNFGVIEPDFKIQLNMGRYGSFSGSPKKENKVPVQAA